LSGALAPFTVIITCLGCNQQFEATLTDEPPIVRRSDRGSDARVVTVAGAEIHRCPAPT
jgi:hypothetical protein